MTEVTVYSTPGCKFCKKTKNFLDEEGIDYEEKNVAEDSEALKTMVKASGQKGVPVTVIGDEDEVIVGFEEGKLREAIGI